MRSIQGCTFCTPLVVVIAQEKIQRRCRRRCTMYLRAALFLGAIYAVCGDATSVASENVTCSPPDVYPPNGTYVGEVEVRMVPNQPDAPVYWVKSEVTEKPITDVPSNTTRLYTGPISLFEPGTWRIQAIALPKFGGLLDSPIVSRTYHITPSDVPIPTVVPSKGKYRGMVRIELRASAAAMVEPDAKLMFVVDVDDPGNTWQTYTAPIVLDTPGEHIVKARVVIGSGGGQKVSPTARYRFEISPPLVYDITTECSKCSELPTLGKTFTVWLQSAEVNSVLFLTTSSKGCENNKHILDDTEYRTVRFRQLAYRFVTYTEPQPKVYVCLREPSHPNGTFITVPKRIKANAQGVSESFFSIEPAFGAVKRQPTEAPHYGPTRQPFADSGSFSVSFIVVFSVLVIAIVATCASMGKLMRTKQFNHQRIPKAAVAEEVA